MFLHLSVILFTAGSVSRGSLSGGGICQGYPHRVTCGQYPSYWDAFLFLNNFISLLQVGFQNNYVVNDRTRYVKIALRVAEHCRVRNQSAVQAAEIVGLVFHIGWVRLQYGMGGG